VAACGQKRTPEPTPGAPGGAGESSTGGTSNQPSESPSEQLLYDLGTNPPANVYHLHVDGETLYWAQKAGKLMRGPKSGGGKPEQFATFESVAEGSEIRSDATHVYYYDGHFVKRKPKAGGTEQRYDVGESNIWGNFIVEGDYIYQATPWCSPVYRIDKVTGEQVVWTVPGVTTGSGGAELTLIGDNLYCANVGTTDTRIYEIAEGAKAAVVIHEESHIMFGFAGMQGALYFSSGGSSIDLMNFFRLDVSTRETKFLIRATTVAAGELQADAGRKTLFVNYPSTRGLVGTFRPETLEFSALIPSGRLMRHAFTTDSDYVYWAQWGSAGTPEQIRRISKDAPPVASP